MKHLKKPSLLQVPKNPPEQIDVGVQTNTGLEFNLKELQQVVFQ